MLGHQLGSGEIVCSFFNVKVKMLRAFPWCRYTRIYHCDTCDKTLLSRTKCNIFSQSLVVVWYETIRWIKISKIVLFVKILIYRLFYSRQKMCDQLPAFTRLIGRYYANDHIQFYHSQHTMHRDPWSFPMTCKPNIYFMYAWVFPWRKRCVVDL